MLEIHWGIRFLSFGPKLNFPICWFYSFIKKNIFWRLSKIRLQGKEYKFIRAWNKGSEENAVLQVDFRIVDFMISAAIERNIVLQSDMVIAWTVWQ